MNNQSKIIVFLLLLNIVSIALIIYRYEGILSKQQADLLITPVAQGEPVKKSFTAEEIKTLIRNSREYIGDTITLLESGEIISSNSKFRGTLNAVINSETNMELVRYGMVENRLPVQYNIYIIAAAFYRDQYKNEFAK